MNSLTIGRGRLASQGISAPRHQSPAEVAAWFGAIQGQDYAGSLWAFGLRLPGTTQADIEQALADKSIVRTWLMRGTIHFAASQDVRWLLGLLSQRSIASAALRARQLELTDATFKQSQDLFANALHGGNILTRESMYQLLDTNGIPTTGQRGYHLLWHAALEGVICYGPMQGKQQTFVLLDDWVPPTKPVPRDEACAELAYRYFSSHGPATLPDFINWSGLPATEARAGMNAVVDRLAYETIDGQGYWGLPESFAPTLTNTFRLLPGFDEYVLGYRNRSDVLPPEHAAKICPGNNGIFMPSVVMDGQIVGTWAKAARKRQVVLTLKPFYTPHGIDPDLLRTATAEYECFLGTPFVMSELDR